jgi:hypothetical protein
VRDDVRVFVGELFYEQFDGLFFPIVIIIEILFLEIQISNQCEIKKIIEFTIQFG